MRKLMLGAVLALVLPVAALAAEGAPSPTELATTACKTEKSKMGTKTFKQTYAAKSAAKAMKACLAKQGVVAEADLKNAAHACKTEAATMGAEAFALKYAAAGTNHNGRNAHGKCVSSRAKAASAEKTADRVAAAETCKALKKDDAATFKTTFGERKNAFGKCVSKTAAELADAKQA
jgi:hypothetical protein